MHQHCVVFQGRVRTMYSLNKIRNKNSGCFSIVWSKSNEPDKMATKQPYKVQLSRHPSISIVWWEPLTPILPTIKARQYCSFPRIFKSINIALFELQKMKKKQFFYSARGVKWILSVKIKHSSNRRTKSDRLNGKEKWKVQHSCCFPLGLAHRESHPRKQQQHADATMNSGEQNRSKN
jgi:hypothetical protein